MRPSLERIEFVVCKRFGLNWTELRSISRHPTIVRARRVFVLLCRERTVSSYPEIAHHLHRVNHSSVKTQRDDGLSLLETDAEFAADVAACREELDHA